MNMKLAMTAASSKTARLGEIQQQMREICAPVQYDEYYKVTTERGFTKITIPKTKSTKNDAAKA